MAINHFDNPVTYAAGGDPIIRMRAINKVFHTAAGNFTVLKDLDVDVRQGEFVSVVGRSGSGKSTLANMITGIDHPTSGSVEIGGVPIHKLPESRMAVWRGKNLGIVFQFFQLLPMLTLVENVMLPMDFCNIYPPASRETRALELLKRVGLDGLAHKLPGAVAGGQQQSAAVARALANDPPILIADEPTGNLDSHTAESVMALFEELVALGKTVLMVTHDRTLALRTTRTLLISDGELVNETVARAFPDLPHPDLLRLSKLAEPLRLPAGAPLPAYSSPAAAPVVLVENGSLARVDNASSSVVGPGSMLDLQSAPKSSWRAGEQGAALLVIPRAEFQSLKLPPRGSLHSPNDRHPAGKSPARWLPFLSRRDRRKS